MAGLGLSNAVSQFFGAQRAAATDQFTARVRKSQTAQLDDEDSRLSDLNAARAAGAAVMAQRQSEADQAPQAGLGLVSPSAKPDPSLPSAGAQVAPAPAMNAASADSAAATPGYGASSASAPPSAPVDPSVTPAAAPAATAAPGLGDVQSAGQSKSKAVNPDHVLEAYNATANELAKRGRLDDWAKEWQKAAGMRDMLRSQALDKAENEFRLTGDPTVFARNAYKYFDDGHSFVKSEKTVGADGQPIYNITRRDDNTGAEETRPMSTRDLLQGAAFARDPQAVRKQEAEYAMKQLQAQIDLKKIVDEETVKQPGREKIESMKTDSAQQIAATNNAVHLQGIGIQQSGENSRSAAGRSQALMLAGMGADGKPSAALESEAQLIAAGKIAPPSGLAATRPATAMLMKRVAEINPEFDASSYQAKVKASKDFGTGSQGNAMRSFAVAGQHLDQLGTLVDGLKNNNMQIVNKVANAYEQQTGNPAPTNFDAAKAVVSKEVVKAIVAGGGGVSEREELSNLMDKAKSPAQLKGVIAQYRNLMAAQHEALLQQRDAAGLPRSTLPIYKDANGSPASAPPIVSHPADITDLLKKYGK